MFKLHHHFSYTSGSVAYLEITPGDNHVHILSYNFLVLNSVPTVLEVIENPTFDSGTTEPDIITNLNRKLDAPSATTFSVDPTNISGGTLIDYNIMTPNTSITNAVNDKIELILKPNVTTILKFSAYQSPNAGDFLYDLVFYESIN